MDEITCPLCKDKILLIPDLNEMNKATANHVKNHVKEMKYKKASKPQILKQKKKLEEALAKEAIITLCKKQPIDSSTIGTSLDAKRNQDKLSSFLAN